MNLLRPSLKASLWAVALLAALWLPSPKASAQATKDYKFQAIFVSSFIRQIEWPAQRGKFVVGVMRDANVTSVFKQRFRRSANVEVREVRSYEEIRECSLLFVPVTSSVSYSRIRSAIGSASVLLVTEKEGLIEQGSDINLVYVNNRLGFEINRESMSAKNLTVSAYLTRLARSR